MIFTDIRLQNYRSYIDTSFELSAGVNIVVGPNTAGKTNLLEGLMMIAVGKTYKGGDGLVLNRDSDWARLDVHTDTNELRTIKITKNNLSKITKTLEIDDKVYKKITPQIKQPIVLFEPNDLNLLNSQPTDRRDYFDNFIEQINFNHDQLTSDLRRIIAQRNRLLKNQKLDKNQLFTWDVRLCEVADVVVKNRLDLIQKLNEKINDVYNFVASSGAKIELVYSTKIDTSNYSSSLIKNLSEKLELDVIRGFTSVGPHRDDIIVMFDNQPLINTASRGEVRTFMLALKIIELQILEGMTDKRPLLLLDDVFSELDGARRRALTNYLNKYQTIITTTDADVIAKNFSQKANVILI